MNMKSSILDARILIVDDVETNVMVLQYMLTGAGYTAVSSTRDPREVVALYRQNDYDIILLDINMPHMDGYEVMAALRAIETDGYLPILVLTADPAQKLKALQSGAKDFLSKPFDQIEVLTRIHNILEIRLLYNSLRLYNETLEQRVQERTSELLDSYRETVMALTRAAEDRDEETGLHISRISYYCQEFAGTLGMPANFCDEIFYGSPMHDIGKIGIPDRILLKPDGLTGDEWSIMKTHTTLGRHILENSNSPYLKMGADIAQNHHERWDGSGYPAGLKGEAIPVSARIMNICDVYDALRSKRPYKAAFDHERAVQIIMRGDGRTLPEHFDPQISDAFSQRHEIFRDIYETSTRQAGR